MYEAMNGVWMVAVIFALLFALATGRGDAVSAALLESGGSAVTLALSLAGAYALWCGLLGIMEKSGAVAAITRFIRPVFLLFPGVKSNSPAGEAVATNLAANLLGLGNAATPAGLRAMREMNALNREPERPSDAMCMFLVINSSSLQLIPTTVMSMRAAAGSASPADIILPTLCATACSTIVAVVGMRIWLAGEERLRANTGGRRSTGAGADRAYTRRI